MVKTIALLIVPVVGLTIFVSACSLFEDETRHTDPRVEVAISATDSLVSPAHPTSLTVKADNRGSSPVLLGRGSSSCQLAAVVQIGSQQYRVAELRPCTADMVEQWLEPGESLIERWEWDGRILRDHAGELLPPGKYRAWGVAGKWTSRSAVEIEVIRE